MNILLRVLMGTGLFAFGYYLGREVGRGAAITDQLRNSESAGTRVSGGKSADDADD